MFLFSESESKILENKYVSSIGSKGVLIPSSASNGSCSCIGSEYGMKCETTYALDAWYAIPFAIVFLVEIYVIFTNSGPNTTCFGEPV